MENLKNKADAVMKNRGVSLNFKFFRKICLLNNKYIV